MMRYLILSLFALQILISVSCEDLFTGDENSDSDQTERNDSLTDFPLIEEAFVADTMRKFREEFHDFITFSYLFDAVFVNKVEAIDDSWGEVYERQLQPGNQKAEYFWNQSWQLIFMLNRLVESIDYYEMEEQYPTKAEALISRAWLYHNLSVWFGDLPIYEGVEEEDMPPLQTAELNDFIMSDLFQGVEILERNGSGDSLNHLYFAGLNLVCRSYSDSEDWTGAIYYAERIINSGVYSLQTDTSAIYNKSTEMIWGFEKQKDTDNIGVFSDWTYMPITRLTETYLYLIEANYLLGYHEKAIEYLNHLIVRRKGNQISNIYFEAVFVQWKREFSLEGNNFYYLKRFDMAEKELMLSNLFLPIPLSSLEKNSELSQNQ